MPEGPEVAHTAEDLNKILSGSIFLESKVYDDTHRGIKNVEDIAKSSILEKITSKGKRIIFHFQSPKAWLVSFLAMEGKWRWTEPKKHLYFRLTFLVDDKKTNLYFSESRPFGYNQYFTEEEGLKKVLSKVGPDLLKDQITFEQYEKKLLKSKRGAVSNWIVKQEHFSGVGNYIRSEILYHSCIDPKRKIATLTDEERKLLYEMTIKIIKDSYQANGLTISSYKTPNGRKGSYICSVYQLKEDPNGYKVCRLKSGTGQTIFHVPEIQK
jgi:endonuclease-8